MAAQRLAAPPTPSPFCIIGHRSLNWLPRCADGWPGIQHEQDTKLTDLGQDKTVRIINNLTRTTKLPLSEHDTAHQLRLGILDTTCQHDNSSNGWDWNYRGPGHQQVWFIMGCVQVEQNSTIPLSQPDTTRPPATRISRLGARHPWAAQLAASICYNTAQFWKIHMLFMFPVISYIY